MRQLRCQESAFVSKHLAVLHKIFDARPQCCNHDDSYTQPVNCEACSKQHIRVDWGIITQIAAMEQTVLILPDQPAAITTPLFAATGRRPVTANSRAMTSIAAQAGICPPLNKDEDSGSDKATYPRAGR